LPVAQYAIVATGVSWYRQRSVPVIIDFDDKTIPLRHQFALEREFAMNQRTKQSWKRNSYETLEKRMLFACDLVGTAGADAIEIIVGPESVMVSINDDIHTCERDSISIDALGGIDSVFIIDDAGDDLTELLSDSVIVTGQVDINVTHVESSYVRSGGGYDIAVLVGTEAVETAYGTSNGAFVRGVNFDQRVTAYDQIFAKMGAGNDVAYLSDSEDDNVFVANEETARMNYPGSFIEVSGHTSVFANANLGGDDQAIFNGSEADDHVYATEQFSTIRSENLLVRASGFTRVLANPSGGNDSATAVNTETEDVFYGMPGFANFKFGDTSGISLIEFESVSVYTPNDTPERDQAYIFGTQNSKLYSRARSTIFQGEGFTFYVDGIADVEVEMSGRNNHAYFVDDLGTSTFNAKRFSRASSNQSYGLNTSFYDYFTAKYFIEANGFDSAHATALVPGESSARFSWAERFYANSNNSVAIIDGFTASTQGFHRVAGRGNDSGDTIAVVIGTDNDEVLEVGPTILDVTRLAAADDSYEIGADRFRNIYLDGKGGDDVAEYVNGSRDEYFSFANGAGLFQFIKFSEPYNVSTRNFSMYTFLASPYERMNGTAFLFDSAGNDHLEATNDRLTLTGDDYVIVLNEVPRVYATANQGGVNTLDVDESYTGEVFPDGDWITV